MAIDKFKNAKDFVSWYCKNNGMTERDFYSDNIPMPDSKSPHGFAAVSNSPLTIKAHVELHYPDIVEPLRLGREITIGPISLISCGKRDGQTMFTFSEEGDLKAVNLQDVAIVALNGSYSEENLSDLGINISKTHEPAVKFQDPELTGIARLERDLHRNLEHRIAKTRKKLTLEIEKAREISEWISNSDVPVNPIDIPEINEWIFIQKGLLERIQHYWDDDFGTGIRGILHSLVSQTLELNKIDDDQIDLGIFHAGDEMTNSLTLKTWLCEESGSPGRWVEKKD